MLVVETIAKIRRAYFSRKMTIKAICRDLRVSRKVVRKVIRSNATEFHYQREVSPSRRSGLGESGLIRCFWRTTAAGARAADADPGLRGTACARL